MPSAGTAERAQRPLPLRPAAVLALASAAWWSLDAGPARAFPDTGFPYPGAGAGPATAPYPGAGLNPEPANAAPGDVQRQISGGPAAPTPGQPQPGWTFIPRVDVSEVFNDNIFQTRSFKQSDFITYITPAITVHGDLPRVQANLFYAPTGIIYASHGNQDMVAQNLNASAHVAIVPDTFYVDLRGYAAVQPTFGGVPTAGGGFAVNPGYGLSSNTSPFLSRSNSTQSYTFGIAPYYVHRFGTFGTLKAGVSYTYSNYSSLSNDQAVFLGGSGGNNGTEGSLNTTAEVLQFTSGEDFGRFRELALGVGTQYEGGGVTQGAYTYIFTNQLGYAVTRTVTVFGELGAEDIRFNGTPRTTITDAVWAAGVQWTPNPETTVTVGYGHKYGQNGAILNAYYQVSPRTTLFAQYQTGLGTDLTQLQSFALATDVDLYGSSIDPTTGAPLYLSNGVLGVSGNNNLYRNKTLSAGGFLALDRDQLSLRFLWQDRQTIATTNVLTSGSSSGFSAIVTWLHDLTPDLQSSLTVSYGRQNGLQFIGSGSVVEDTYVAQAGLRYSFTPTLSGILQYTFTDRVANFNPLSFTQNVVLIGLSKSF